MDSLCLDGKHKESPEDEDTHGGCQEEVPITGDKSEALVMESRLELLESERLTGSREPGEPICMAFAHAELGNFYYSLCDYSLAYRFAQLALEQIIAVPCPPRVVVHVLRLACRICIIQRKYALGMRLITWLAKYTRYVFRNLLKLIR